MATLLLAAAGSTLGGLFGTTAGVIGQAAGAVIGGLLDRRLFGGTRSASVGRLASLDVQSSDEGAPIARVFGRMRVSGEVIWAASLEEESNTESAGGKGASAKVTSYSYFANFAVGLCEGPIARVGRVWANGKLLDLTRVTMRVHLGDETQEADALIVAREEIAPAYRGLAYVVFERLPLEDFGNGLPQLSFEVIRPVGRLEGMIRAVTLIPAATEFGYATTEVTRRPARGTAETENRHAATATTDLAASLDELQAVCPRLEAVAVVVTWFGDDLRAGECRLRPKVENADKTTSGLVWRTAGLTRATAALVSRTGGQANFGGTPADDSVREVIAELKRRGLQVTFYPFVMMDVPPGNGLADPYGAAEQAAFPWRGRITCHPARGAAASPWGTAAADAEIAAFLGVAARADFALDGSDVVYAGADDWGYRRMILHYAELCAAAGGVDCFLVGSELRGLTTVRGAAGYPFVDGLVALATDVKAILGAATAVSYAADWSEWTGFDLGGGDFAFHLDSLWAADDVDFVGIDAYFPLSDWRDGAPADLAVADGPLDPDYLAANVAGGEGFDWYYASDADRIAGNRAPIADGLGKPWLWRYKDLVSWWSNPHHDRTGGAEATDPSPWRPGLKPIRFTEIGCPAVDCGGNEPNVFPDRLSSEGRAPWFSHGRRDDAAQRRYLEAFLAHFDPAAEGFAEADNPLSSLDGRRMVDVGRAHVWTWDARPYPWFPLAADVWADGGNWQTGHWLVGRLGGAPLREVVEALVADLGVGSVDASRLTAVVDGLAVAERMSARAVLEDLAGPLLFGVAETADGLAFADRQRRFRAALSFGELATADGEADVRIVRSEAAAIPGAVAITFRDSETDGLSGSVAARRPGAPRVEDVGLPVMASASVMQGAAEAWLKDMEASRESYVFRLPPTRREFEAGDLISLDFDDRSVTLRIASLEDGESRRVEAETTDADLVRRSALPAASRSPASVAAGAAPELIALDLPARDGDGTPYRPWIAAALSPWPGRIFAAQVIGAGFGPSVVLPSAAVIGTLTAPLAVGPVWRFDRSGMIEVTLVRGTLASVDEDELLSGANLAAVGSAKGGWEIVQFATAQLVGARHYRLSMLLRGQAGTEEMASSGAATGDDFVLLDAAVRQLPIPRAQVGRPLTLKASAVRLATLDARAAELVATPSGTGLRPLAPVRLRARRSAVTGDVALSWIRRTRIGGDDFDGVEVALGETSERYRLRVFAGADVVREAETTAPTFAYSAADQATDFGTLPAELTVSVVQLSETMGEGTSLTATLPLS